MGTQGFWSADLEATVARMNATVVQFTIAASRPAASSATEGMIHVATDTLVISYDNGGTWVDMGTLAIPSQAEAEAGTATIKRVWTAERVKQAIDALGAGITEAAAGDMEDEGASNPNRYVSPEVADRAPSASKVWVASALDGTNQGSHNIASITDTGTGNQSYTIGTDFSGTGYVAFPSIFDDSGILLSVSVSGRATGAMDIKVFNDADTLTDPGAGFMMIAFGDQ